MFARKRGSRNLPQKARQGVPEGDVVFPYSFFFFFVYYVIEPFLTTLKNSIWHKGDERKKNGGGEK